MAQLDKFFALSTCVHCRHTREFLENNHVQIAPMYVDKLGEVDREAALADMSKYNPQLSFPTLVFSNGEVVVGFQPEAIGKELGL